MAYGRKRKIYRRRKGAKRVRRVGARRIVRGINYAKNPLELLKLHGINKPHRQYPSRRRRQIIYLNSPVHEPIYSPLSPDFFSPGQREGFRVMDELGLMTGGENYDPIPTFNQAGKFVLGNIGRSAKAVGTFADHFIPGSSLLGDGIDFLAKYAAKEIPGTPYKTKNKFVNAALSHIDGEDRPGSLVKYTDTLGKLMLGAAPHADDALAQLKKGGQDIINNYRLNLPDFFEDGLDQVSGLIEQYARPTIEDLDDDRSSRYARPDLDRAPRGLPSPSELAAQDHYNESGLALPDYFSYDPEDLRLQERIERLRTHIPQITYDVVKPKKKTQNQVILEKIGSLRGMNSPMRAKQIKRMDSRIARHEARMSPHKPDKYNWRYEQELKDAFDDI